MQANEVASKFPFWGEPKKMPHDKTKYIAHAVLILEAVMILLMGFLVGVLVPDSISVQIRLALSRSIVYLETQQVIYTALVLAGFLIVHQYMCWIWKVKESRRRYVEINRWGNIIFLYGCTGLILFSVWVFFWQIIGL